MKQTLLAALMLASVEAYAGCVGSPANNWCMPDFRGDGNSPIIIDHNGNYRGNLNSNRYDPNSISNPYGRYGSRYSSESLNNPYAYPQNQPLNLYFR